MGRLAEVVVTKAYAATTTSERTETILEVVVAKASLRRLLLKDSHKLASNVGCLTVEIRMPVSCRLLGTDLGSGPGEDFLWETASVC